MITKGQRQITTVTFGVNVTRADIQNGDCRDANRCMVRVAVERALRELDSKKGNHHTRVDAGHIRFNLYEHRYVADTPKIAKASLIKFDKEDTARRVVERRGETFRSAVEPFRFKITAVQGRRIEPMTRERQDQINEARRRRIAAGKKDNSYTLRDRIVGFA